MPSNPDQDEAQLFQPPPSTRSAADIDAAEAQIVKNINDVRYIVREYPVEVVVQKYLSGIKSGQNEIYVPDYQRELIWPERNKSRFIESLLIGLPIPFLFVADVSEAEDPDNAGRLEIIDGVQRIRTLTEFLTNNLALTGLDRLTKLVGSKFSDLHPSRQRRFRRATLRLIELTEGITEDVRREMFDRINSGSVGLEAVEVRRGMAPGLFVDLTTELANDPLLQKLAPISDALKKRFEYEELVTRFFAFLNRYQTYGTGTEGKVVKDFLLTYVKDMNKALAGSDGAKLKQAMKSEWKMMLEYVRDNFEHGFQKFGRGKKVPRVRFEAISVGVGLALRADPKLKSKDTAEWLNSDEFKEWTTSDASNNKQSVTGRMEFLKNKLLEK
jgi:hypothetical protein